MQLIVDEGNTQIKLAVFDENQTLREVFTVNTFDTVLSTIKKKFQINRVLLAGVGSHTDSLNQSLTKHFPEVYYLKSASEIALPNQYKSIATLGVDRLANAAFCIHQHKFPALVIDCGTCLKFDLVDESGVYQGGSISPGLSMRFRAMHQFTEKLPELVPQVKAIELVGNNTAESLLSGAQLGMHFEIDGRIDNYLSQHSELKIFITGGDAQYFVKGLKNNIFADPFLTLRGLNEILIHS